MPIFYFLLRVISTFDFAITLMTRLSRGVTDPTGNIFCFLKFLLTRLSQGVTGQTGYPAVFGGDFYSHASLEA